MALERVRASLGAAARWRRRGRAPEQLGDRELSRLREKIEACLDPRVSGVAVRNRAAEVAEIIAGADQHGLERFFALLVESFGPDLALAARHASRLTATFAAREDDHEPAATTTEQLHTLATIRRAATPRWEQLFELLCGLTDGVKFAVDLRAELLSMLREHPQFRPLDSDLQRVLSRLFPPGLLELRRLSWNSPAALLEKLIEYEAVHAIASWDDLKNRLDDRDRRCYAFIHPGMPDEPLIFVEVALLDDMASDVVSLLDVTAPQGTAQQATTAIFYSISACQRGLAGVNLGDVLIKEVVADLSRDLPRLNRFATLSPLPGLRKWLDTHLAAGDTDADTDDLFTAEDRRLLTELVPDAPGPRQALATALAGPWAEDAERSRRLRELLTGLCVDYLIGTESAGRSQDRVANFHLTNGAQVERLNWLANPTPAGMAESYGMMVNYRYDLARIDANHESYVSSGQIARSSAIGRLVASRRRSRGNKGDTG